MGPRSDNRGYGSQSEVQKPRMIRTSFARGPSSGGFTLGHRQGRPRASTARPSTSDTREAGGLQRTGKLLLVKDPYAQRAWHRGAYHLAARGSISDKKRPQP